MILNRTIVKHNIASPDTLFVSTFELPGRMLNEICYLDGKPLLEYVLPAVIRELKKNQVHYNSLCYLMVILIIL